MRQIVDVISGEITWAEDAPIVPPSAEELHATLVNAANNALTISDRVALRCWKAGVAFPAEWLTWTNQCRAISNGTDTSSTSIPTQPAYPSGT